MTKSKTLLRATDPDASEYKVTDGQGRKITNCFEADTFQGTVTVSLVGSDGVLAFSDDDEVVRVTYRPKGGVIITYRELVEASSVRPDTA